MRSRRPKDECRTPVLRSGLPHMNAERPFCVRGGPKDECRTPRSMFGAPKNERRTPRSACVVPQAKDRIAVMM